MLHYITVTSSVKIVIF